MFYCHSVCFEHAGRRKVASCVVELYTKANHLPLFTPLCWKMAVEIEIRQMLFSILNRRQNFPVCVSQKNRLSKRFYIMLCASKPPNL